MPKAKKKSKASKSSTNFGEDVVTDKENFENDDTDTNDSSGGSEPFDSSIDLASDDSDDSDNSDDNKSSSLSLPKSNSDVSNEPNINDESASASQNSPELRSVAQTQDTMMRVTEVVINALDKLKDGQKTTLKALQNLVTEQTGLKSSSIGPVISMIVKTHGGVTVELGRYGGIYKGIRVKPEKVEDNKVRCTHCNQVIRQKTGPRKKKNKPAEGESAALATGMTSGSENLSSKESKEDEDLNEEFDDFEDDDDDSDEEENSN